MEERFLGLDLHNYLLSLSSELSALGEQGASSQITHVSKFISGSTSELFGETAVLLPKILLAHGEQMTEAGRARLRLAIDNEVMTRGQWQWQRR